jgi:sirohydrochlorin ferrochelatase
MFENHSQSRIAAMNLLKSLLFSALAASSLFVAPSTVAGQAAAKTGVIVVAHGGSDAWNEGVLAAARVVRQEMPAEVAFLMGTAAPTHRLQEQVARLEREGVTSIVVVPLLVSSHSGHYEQIRWIAGLVDSLDAVMMHHLHMAGIERVKTRLPVRVAAALDDAPELAEILAQRARALAPDPRSQALLLLGHGPNSAEDYAAWMANLRRVASRVKSMSGFRDVRVELVRDDAPEAVRAEAVLRARELISLQSEITSKDVVVVPILIARSSIGDEKLKRDLEGLPIRYSGEPLLPHPLIAEWIKRRAREVSVDP